MSETSDDEGQLGLFGAVSISVGGMIGGGVFAVLGVVATIAGAAAWLAFTLACLVSMCAAYSYLKLNAVGDRRGGSVSQLEEHLDSATPAGMAGWTLLVGYVGAIAMYAYAFGSFGVALSPESLKTAIPLGEELLRPAYSVLAVGLFVALNVVGARATGTSEELLVVAKVAVLVVFGGLGLWYGLRQSSVELGVDQIRAVSPIVMATAVSFVSFQGWQLLMYDQERIEDPLDTLPKAIYGSIVVTILIDGLIAVVVTSLASPAVIRAHPERALANAVEPIVGSVGFVVVAVAALFSTGSAINGTLFSAAHFAKGMVTDDLLPERVGHPDGEGVPERTILLLGGVTAVLTASGSLDAITSFGSLAFMIVFGSMCALAFRERGRESIRSSIPAIGAVGCGVFTVLLGVHLWRAERETFWTVLVLAVVVVTVEVLYFKRERIADGVDRAEARLTPGEA